MPLPYAYVALILGLLSIIFNDAKREKMICFQNQTRELMSVKGGTNMGTWLKMTVY